MDTRQEQFTQELLRAQARLRLFIRAMVPHRAAAEDVLQQTNLVLCRKSETFEPGTDFVAWAFAIARYEVLKQRQKFARERLVFDDSVAETLADAATSAMGDLDQRADALHQCLGKLSGPSRDLIHRRYAQAQGNDQIAEQTGRPAGSIRQTIYRIRMQLMKCIQTRLGQAGAAGLGLRAGDESSNDGGAGRRGGPKLAGGDL